MIEITCKENIEEILTNPSEYVDFDYDKALIKYYGKDVTNPTWILIGQDENDKLYLTVEDNDVSADYYVEDGQTIKELFYELLDDIQKED